MIAAYRELVPAAAALGRLVAAAGAEQNLGLAHEPGFEWAEVGSGPVVGSVDWTRL
jgi:hypothetical protein